MPHRQETAESLASVRPAAYSIETVQCSLTTACWSLACRLQNGANDRSGQPAAFSLQPLVRSNFVFLDGRARLFNLSLGFIPCPGGGGDPGLQCLLPTRLLILENRHTSFPQSLLVLGGPRFRGSNISAGL